MDLRHCTLASGSLPCILLLLPFVHLSTFLLQLAFQVAAFFAPAPEWRRPFVLTLVVLVLVVVVDLLVVVVDLLVVLLVVLLAGQHCYDPYHNGDTTYNKGPSPTKVKW